MNETMPGTEETPTIPTEPEVAPVKEPNWKPEKQDPVTPRREVPRLAA